MLLDERENGFPDVVVLPIEVMRSRQANRRRGLAEIVAGRVARLLGLPCQTKRRHAKAANGVSDAPRSLLRTTHPIQRADFKRRGLTWRDQELGLDATTIRFRPALEGKRCDLGAKGIPTDKLRHTGLCKHI